jgi:hypothetical protein
MGETAYDRRTGGRGVGLARDQIGAAGDRHRLIIDNRTEGLILTGQKRYLDAFD